MHSNLMCLTNTRQSKLRNAKINGEDKDWGAIVLPLVQKKCPL